MHLATKIYVIEAVKAGSKLAVAAVPDKLFLLLKGF